MPAAFTAELPPQEDGEPGRETIVVRFADGRHDELRLHDYDRLYAIAGLYEEIIQRRLECRSPDQIATMLVAAAALVGWEPERTRVLDVGAGNGVSGEALAAHGLRPVAGVDILASAREAALRDRPGLYEAYLAADLLALGDDDRRTIRALEPNALACVGAMGRGHTPPAALAAAVDLLAEDALVAYACAPDAPDGHAWTELLDDARTVEELDRRRFRHRLTVNRQPILWDAVVLRMRRTHRAEEASDNAVAVA